jgi:hypothetical protein
MLQWGCLAMVVGIIALSIVGGIWLLTKPPADPAGSQPTAVVWTTTPTPMATRAPTATPLAISPGQVGVGIRVRVTGTGDAGLSIRSEPTTTADRVSVAEEGESLLIVSGPQEADGYTWWFVRDELDATREGWAAQDFLAPVD